MYLQHVWMSGSSGRKTSDFKWAWFSMLHAVDASDFWEENWVFVEDNTQGGGGGSAGNFETFRKKKQEREGSKFSKSTRGEFLVMGWLNRIIIKPVACLEPGNSFPDGIL